MQRRLYSLAHYLILPLVLLYLGWRGVKNPGYWQRWGERLGFAPAIGLSERTLWIHAVSVGEVQAALPLVKALRLGYPNIRILLTTTTPTGADRITQALRQGVHHCYVPYDLPSAVRRFLDRVHPELAIIMETELWPNIFKLCRDRSIPVLLVNGRLSAQAARRYHRLGGLVRAMLSDVSAIAAQTLDDAERFIALGAKSEQVVVTGSIKFDVDLPTGLGEQAQALRRCWGIDRRVWIAASTHEGEEEQVLDAFAQVLRALPNTLLVLVPRHPERFAKTAELCRKRGYRTVLRSQGPGNGNTAEVFIGNSMGELLVFYAAADLAFVGGSLVSVGGHNLLEPAALGIPVVVGPYLFNFAEIGAKLCAAGAARTVHSSPELAELTIELLQDRHRRRRMGAQAKRFVEDNRGALNQVLAMIEPLMTRQAPSATDLRITPQTID